MPFSLWSSQHVCDICMQIADSSELHILHLMGLMTDNVEQFVRNQRSQNPLLPFVGNA